MPKRVNFTAYKLHFNNLVIPNGEFSKPLLPHCLLPSSNSHRARVLQFSCVPAPGVSLSFPECSFHCWGHTSWISFPTPYISPSANPLCLTFSIDPESDSFLCHCHNSLYSSFTFQSVVPAAAAALPHMSYHSGAQAEGAASIWKIRSRGKGKRT